MLRTIDRILIAAVVLLGIGEFCLFYKAADTNRNAVFVPDLPGMLAPKPGMPVSGEIEKLESNTLTIKNIPGLKDSMHFQVSDVTAIVEQAAKDPAKMRAEMQAFSKEVQKGPQLGIPIMPPTPFEEKKVGLSALKLGSHVVVVPGNATDKKDVAEKINIIQTMAPPSSPLAVPVMPNNASAKDPSVLSPQPQKKAAPAATDETQ